MFAIFLTCLLILIFYHYIIRKPLIAEMPRQLQCNERHAVQTRDGVLLPLYRYRPEKKRCSYPVILCHGMAVNAFHLDNGFDLSLPTYLQEHGLEVWLIELRGSGKATKIPWCGGADSFTFDDYVAEDLPAIISNVCRISGSDKVHWMGHSMGGMVCYGYIARFDDSPFASLTTIASAIDFSFWTSPQKKPAWKLFYRIMALFPFVPNRKLGRFLFPFVPRMMEKLKWAKEFTKIIDVRNLKRHQSFAFFYNALSDLSRGLVLQTIGWVISGRMDSLDGQLCYTDGLSKMSVPLHVIASTGDVSIPLDSITAGYDKSSSEVKKLTILKPTPREKTVFGHADMVHASACYTEFFPLLHQWIHEQDSSQMHGHGREDNT